MAYPFLPVNPCCTDVVLNTPCGCSSTVTNSGCNNNNPCSTHLTASSTIVYDGPVLPCIVAEPCDTLNVILQKIDEIICNLLTQINYLSNQVTNITNQIIMINGDIINIYNTLGECCGATTTTTSTTTAAPCESFSLDNTGPDPVAIIITDCITGEQEAIVLLPGETNICVETDSPLTVPGTVIVTPNGPCGPTTTTTTTIVPTTTTTTTISPCECLTFYNGSVATQEITYIDCNGDQQYDLINIGATNSYCGCCGEAPGSIDVTITIGANCIDGLCPAEPSTTTTTTTVACNCFDTEITILSETLATTDDGQLTALYNDCFGNPYINTYNRPGVYSLGCVEFIVGINVIGMIDGTEHSIYVPITVGSPCCDATTTTTTTDIPPTTTTTTTLPCNCVDIIISQADIDDATGNSFLNGFVNVEGTDGKKITCEGEDIILHYNEAGTYSYCLKGEVIPTMSLYYLKDNDVITTIESEIINLATNCLVDGECIPTTTTTTTVEPTTTTTTTSTTLPSVTICSQIWTLENLDVETYRNGDVIPQVTDPIAWENLTTGAWCYYNNDSANGPIYGKLYNWYAVTDPRGLAPIGYHVPTDAEFETLIVTCLGGETVAGGKMKSTGTTLWNSPNTDATNSSGFTGLPAGSRNYDGQFLSINDSAAWWTSTPNVPPGNPLTARSKYVVSNFGFAYNLNTTKTTGLSVRLIKD